MANEKLLTILNMSRLKTEKGKIKKDVIYKDEKKYLIFPFMDLPMSVYFINDHVQR